MRLCTTFITADYLTIQDKTEKVCCTLNQNLTITLIKLTKTAEEDTSHTLLFRLKITKSARYIFQVKVVFV